eukprot:3342134-Rhodomonas_salina.1
MGMRAFLVQTVGRKHLIWPRTSQGLSSARRACFSSQKCCTRYRARYLSSREIKGLSTKTPYTLYQTGAFSV